MNKTYDIYPISLLRSPAQPYQPGLSYEELAEAVKDTYFLNALQLASSNLHRKVRQALLEHGELPKNDPKLLTTLYKYLVRMKTRCTPFGLFAGTSLLTFGTETHLVSQNRDQWEVKAKLDMTIAAEVINQLKQQPGWSEREYFVPNETIIEFQGKLRYLMRVPGTDRMKFELCTVDTNDYLTALLPTASGGMRKIEMIRWFQMLDEELTEEEIREFLDELIQEQVLVPQLNLTAAGKEPLENVLSLLQKSKSWSAEKSFASTLAGLSETLKEGNTQGRFGNELLGRLTERVKELLPEYDRSPVATDLYKPLKEAQLDEKVGYELKEMVAFLASIDLPNDSAHDRLETFKQQFSRRYENREVSLVEVLDLELGIGYAGSGMGDLAPFLKDVSPGQQSGGSVKMTTNQFRLFQQLVGHPMDTPMDLKKMAFVKTPTPTEWPDSLAAMYSVRMGKDGQVSLEFDGATGPSALNVLGRFASTSDSMKELCDDLVEREKSKYPEDTVLAEVVHLPGPKQGNIVFRPSFRDYEIPIGAPSERPVENQILIGDLMVSVQNNEVVLRSKRLNKRVVPRKANAQSFRQSALPIYQFLCDLQFQSGITGVYFKWENMPYRLKRYPALYYGVHQVSPATWCLAKSDFEELLKNDLTLETIRSWRARWQVPSEFLLADGDLELLIDLETEAGLAVFQHAAKNESQIVLKEFTAAQDEMILHDALGEGYHHKLISFLTLNKKHQPFSFQLPKTGKVQRRFSLGSEWMFVKIYGSTQTADSVLVRNIYPLINKWSNEGLMKQWFFIRYADPDPHLRLRLRLVESSDYPKLLQELNHELEELRESGKVQALLPDDYIRELERYGPESMEDIEHFFHADSEATVHFLSQLPSLSGDRERWSFFVHSIDDMFNQLEFDLNQKLDLMGILKQSFDREFKAGRIQKIQMDKKFRATRKTLEEVLNPKMDSDASLADYVLKHRSEIMGDHWNRIRQQIEAGDAEWKNRLASMVHMIGNRIFCDRQRLYEFVIYNLMHKFYISLKARKAKAEVALEQ
ncbi:lantibiotic dehydratase [bacterium SCSIO 12741]|nr:lantibiotic dehydratase [bacterium SCSIO 12741]